MVKGRLSYQTKIIYTLRSGLSQHMILNIIIILLFYHGYAAGVDDDHHHDDHHDVDDDDHLSIREGGATGKDGSTSSATLSCLCCALRPVFS